jgi:hypothetical protein
VLLTFALDGTPVFKVETDVTPQPGDEVIFRLAIDKERLEKGALVSATVSGDRRRKYDFDTLAPRTWVDLTDYNVMPMFG